ncbi:MAG: hypothetical protein WDN06_23030 [Asticcacaulis sp.]
MASVGGFEGDAVAGTEFGEVPGGKGLAADGEAAARNVKEDIAAL